MAEGLAQPEEDYPERRGESAASVATAASPLCALVWASLKWQGPGSAEEVALAVGCRPGQAMEALARLWRAGFVKRRAGRWESIRDYGHAVMTCGETRRL